MAILKKHEVKKPAHPREAVAVPSLGGEVHVRALKLQERLQLAELRDREPQEQMCHVLAVCVLVDGDEPLFDAHDWMNFSAANVDEFFTLWDVARKLSGLGGQEKN